jgi:hypothetical protein
MWFDSTQGTREARDTRPSITEGKKMNLSLTYAEMQILLSLTANASFYSEANDTLWRKVSAEFVRTVKDVKERENWNKEHGTYQTA